MHGDSAPWMFVATGLLAALGFVVWVHTRRWARRPRVLTPPLAFAVWLGLEVVTFRVLSLFSAVHRPAVLVTHLGWVLLGVALAPRACSQELRALGATLRRAGQRRRGWLIAAPVLGLALVSALRYAPNNWDAMSYHLARIAHWIQRGSVAPYPTNQLVQNAYAAGPAYGLLTLQVVADSDRAVWLLQAVACAIVLGAAWPLARLGGARRGVARWAWLFPLTLPMLVLEATSAQTDLVAAALGLAVVVATVPFLGGGRPGLREGLLLGTCLGTALVTKMTGVVASLPFVALALARTFRALRPRLAVRVGVWGAAVAAAALLYGLEIDRVRILETVPGHMAAYAFTGWGQWPQRATNVVRATLRNLPLPPAVSRAVQMPDCPRRAWCEDVIRPEEDFAGAPLHTAFVAVLLMAIGIRRRTLPRRTRVFAALLLVSWVGFHCIFRENQWFMRLQLPLFALAPLLFGVIQARRPATRRALAVSAALAWGLAITIAARNERRPPLDPGRVDYAHSYYVGGEWVGLLHDAALSSAAGADCRRMSLWIGQMTGGEYALVWRAMHARIEVRHLVSGFDPWPCLLVTDPGAAPPQPGWEPAVQDGWGAGTAWVRRRTP